MEKHTIINLKQKGFSNRKVSKITTFNRKTVAKYWKEYNNQIDALEKGGKSVSDIQEAIVSVPAYDSTNRKPKKYKTNLFITNLCDLITATVI